MKKLLQPFLAILLTIAFITGCSKENEPEPVTALEISITDNLGTAVEGATVKLYASQDDMSEKRNQIGTSKTTDATGKVMFKDLDATKYYWYAEKGCNNNVLGANQTSAALKAKTENKTTTVLAGTGTLNFMNNSANPYDVFLNGQLAFVAEGNQAYSAEYVKTGAYSVRVLQKSGYAVYPTDKTYNITITCGGTTNVVFPN